MERYKNVLDKPSMTAMIAEHLGCGFTMLCSSERKVVYQKTIRGKKCTIGVAQYDKRDTSVVIEAYITRKKLDDIEVIVENRWLVGCVKLLPTLNDAIKLIRSHLFHGVDIESNPSRSLATQGMDRVGYVGQQSPIFAQGL